jgi:hypothetical protein
VESQSGNPLGHPQNLSWQAKQTRQQKQPGYAAASPRKPFPPTTHQTHLTTLPSPVTHPRRCRTLKWWRPPPPDPKHDVPPVPPLAAPHTPFAPGCRRSTVPGANQAPALEWVRETGTCQLLRYASGSVVPRLAGRSRNGALQVNARYRLSAKPRSRGSVGEIGSGWSGLFYFVLQGMQKRRRRNGRSSKEVYPSS